MIASRKKLWLDALRSGRFAQTRDRLSNEEFTAFCCLGVACEIAMEDLDLEHTADGCYSSDEGKHYDTELPPSVEDWFGLESENPAFPFQTRREIFETCIGANDGRENAPLGIITETPLTFSQIADLIEHFL